MDLDTRELTKDGRRIRLAEKPFLVLAALLERPGELVTREELRRRLWAEDTFVDFDNNLNSAVASVREALCDAARTPRYIETLPRRGYRFVGTLESPAPDASPETLAAGLPRAFDMRRWAASGITLGLLAALIWFANGRWFRPTPATTAATASANKNYVDGIYLLERDNPATLEQAVNLLARAAEEDPGSAVAHAALGEAWLKLTAYGLAPKDSGFAKAESALHRALAIDTRIPAAHRGLAQLMLYRDWNVAAADREIEKAIAADPRDAKNHLVAAMVKAASGRYEESIAAARRAIECDPANWRVRSDLAYFLLAAGHFEEAFAESRAVLALEAEFAPALDFLLASGEHLGRYGEARAAAVKLMQRSRAPESDVRAVQQVSAREGVRRYRVWQVRFVEEKGKRAWPAMTVASIYASAGRADEAFDWLRRAYEGRDMNLVFLGASPDFAGVRNDPRYSEMLRLVGLPAPLPRS